MSESEEDHEQGVDFEPVQPMFEELSYPVSAEELVAEYGDRELERTNAGPISIRDLFEGGGDQSFESEGELRQGMLNMMPDESVGRQNYSDRGGSTQDEIRDEDEDEG
ncbi:MAG: hypothetical protein ABEJ26_04350 [Halosimplex sp.]